MNVTVIAAAATLTGGPTSPLIAWMVIPIVSLAGRFDQRGVWGGAGIVLVALAAICALEPRAFAHDPVLVIAAVPMTLAIGWFSAAMMGAERRSRNESSLDHLTGLLNRRSLPWRFAELAEQARLSDDAVALVALDLDHGAAVAERLRESIAALRPTGVDVRASLGVSAGVGAGVAYGPLFDAADRALYAAKRNGRDRVKLAGAPTLALVA